MKQAANTPEARRANSVSKKRVWNTAEARARRSEVMKRVQGAPDVRRRQSESRRRVLADPSYRRRQSEALRKAWAHPGARRRASEAQKASPKAAAAREKLRSLAKPNGSEQILYGWLEEAGVLYSREFKIGRYFADIFIPDKRLVVECDGYYHNTPERMKHDQKRDAFMTSRGIRVVRIRSQDIRSSKAKVDLLECLA